MAKNMTEMRLEGIQEALKRLKDLKDRKKAKEAKYNAVINKARKDYRRIGLLDPPKASKDRLSALTEIKAQLEIEKKVVGQKGESISWFSRMITKTEAFFHRLVEKSDQMELPLAWPENDEEDEEPVHDIEDLVADAEDPGPEPGVESDGDGLEV